MWTSIILLKRELESIKFYIDGIRKTNETLGYDTECILPAEFKQKIDDLKEYYSGFHRKPFDYKVIIISLYGAFEHFIEELTQNYISYLNKRIPSYSQLPEKIRNNHFDLSAELIGNLKYPKYQNLISKEQIVKNLNSCVEQRVSYKLNKEAYIHHTANFRHDNINEFFSKVGIDGASSKTKKVSLFLEYLERVFPNEDIPGKSDVLVFEKINDIAFRRNEISHGAQIGDLLALPNLLEYIEYIDYYSQALYQVVIQNLFSIEVQYNSKLLGNPINVYGNRIICINSNSNRITLDDYIIAESGEKYYCSKIENLRVQNNDVRSIPARTAVDLGIAVGFNPKMNYNYYLVKGTLDYF